MSDEALTKLNQVHEMLRKLTDVQVSRQELAERFQVDPVTIDRYRRKGLKRLKNGKFPLSESLDWLYKEAGRVPKSNS